MLNSKHLRVVEDITQLYSACLTHTKPWVRFPAMHKAWYGGAHLHVEVETGYEIQGYLLLHRELEATLLNLCQMFF